MSEMTYTQVSLPRALVEQLRERSLAYGVAVEDQIRQVLESYLSREEELANLATHPLLALANLGESSETDISERAEEILATEISPVTGWSMPHADAR